jgi:hypothetical protein
MYGLRKVKLKIKRLPLLADRIYSSPTFSRAFNDPLSNATNDRVLWVNILHITTIRGLLSNRKLDNIHSPDFGNMSVLPSWCSDCYQYPSSWYLHDLLTISHCQSPYLLPVHNNRYFILNEVTITVIV